MRPKFIWLALLLCGSLSIGTTQADTPEWNYPEQTIPGGWGSIRGADPVPVLSYPYATCAVGQKQAPINFTSSEIIHKPSNPLVIHWPKFTADFFNSGHAIQVQPSGSYNGFIKNGRETYALIQAHIHTPSEHTRDGANYPAEMHFVHMRNDGQVIVIATAIEEGAENLELEKMLANTPNTQGVPTHNPTTIPMDLTKLLPKKTSSFYNYMGSLTTPPCSEGVLWFIFDHAITVSTQQLIQLKAFYNNNNRDTQPMNDREIDSNT